MSYQGGPIVQRIKINHSGEYILSDIPEKNRLSGWSKEHARMVRAICAVSGERPVMPWTPHDLRRTVATRIAEQLRVGGEQLINGIEEGALMV